jgi:hypothetical protein
MFIILTKIICVTKKRIEEIYNVKIMSSILYIYNIYAIT